MWNSESSNKLEVLGYRQYIIRDRANVCFFCPTSMFLLDFFLNNNKLNNNSALYN